MMFSGGGLWFQAVALTASMAGAATELSLPSRISRYLNATPDRREEAAQAVLAAGVAEIPTLLDEYARGSAPIRQLVADLLPRFGSQAFDALYAAGQRDFGNPMMGEDNIMWQAAIEAAVRIGPSVFPRAFEILENDDGKSYGRWLFAARALEGSKGIPLDSIERLLKHKEPKVRTEGALLLGRDGSDMAVRRLIASAATEDRLERLAAVRALSLAKNPLSVPVFLAAMVDDATVTREYAAVGLGDFYEPRFRVPIVRMARNDRAASRSVACRVLTRAGGPAEARVASRYMPMGVGPLQVIRMENVAALKLALSGVLAIILGVLTRFTDKRRPFGYLGLVLLGLVWGAWVGNMWWVVETAFIFGVVPGMMFIGAFIESPRPFWHGIWTRWSKLGGVICVGYFVGQTWLWGGSIEWLRLWLPASVAW